MEKQQFINTEIKGYIEDTFVSWPSQLKKKKKANCGDKHKEI